MSKPPASRLLAYARELQRAGTFEELLVTTRAEIEDVMGYAHAWLFVAPDRDAGEWHLIDMIGMKRADARRHAGTLTVRGDAMLEEIARSEEPVVVVDARTDARTNKAIVEQLGNRTIINVPLRLLDESFGALGTGTFGDEEGCRPPTPEHLQHLVAMASQLSVAAGRIRFLDERRRAEEAANKSAMEERESARALAKAVARLELLAESSQLFASTTKVDELIEIVARRLSELIGDGCGIRLYPRGDASAVAPATTYNTDPKLNAAMRELARSEPLALGEGVTGSVAASGESLLIPVITTAQLLARSPQPFHALLEQSAITSLLAVPLRARDRVIGAISMSRSGPGNPYNTDDLRLTQDIADRAALAIENALLVDDLERRVSERTAGLALANRELEAFSYSVAHDLRAPLRAISGFSTALTEDFGDKLDDRGKSHLNRIAAGAGRMAAIIDALLELSRVSRTEPRRSAVNLSDLAEGILGQLRRSDPERTVETEVAKGLTTIGDPNLLESLLDNLLRNAWKFTSKRPSARIELGCSTIEGLPTYFVRDNGAGFDVAYVGTLFTPFRRLHSEADFDGTGIGLATVQRIVVRHGGRIWAEGAVDRGATFWFTLAPPPNAPAR